MGYMSGKKVLILGVASKLSIASGIAEAMHRGLHLQGWGRNNTS